MPIFVDLNVFLLFISVIFSNVYQEQNSLLIGRTVGGDGRAEVIIHCREGCSGPPG